MIKEKKCSKCGIVKSSSHFHKDSKTTSGLHHSCIICKRKYTNERNKTIEGLLYKMYGSQKLSSRKRDLSPPDYTYVEFSLWCKKQVVFYVLFDRWRESNFLKRLVPSVDRIDDYKSYSFSNIQLMTWEENWSKGNLDIIEGRNNKQAKSIKQYDLKGNFIKEYYSQAQAGRDNNIAQANIFKACNGVYNMAGGYVWRYSNHELGEIKAKLKNRAVIRYDKELNLIDEFNSISEAGKKLNINISNISQCCRGSKHNGTAGGYIWKYKEV